MFDSIYIPKRNPKRGWLKFFIWLNIIIWPSLILGGYNHYKEIFKPVEFIFAQYERSESATPMPLPQTIEETIDFYAKRFGVDGELIKRIAQCESGGNPDRIGYEAKVPLNSIGLFQFQPATWVQYVSLYKIRNANIYDWRDQTLVATMMIRDGKASEWSCYKLIK